MHLYGCYCKCASALLIQWLTFYTSDYIIAVAFKNSISYKCMVFLSIVYVGFHIHTNANNTLKND